MSKIRALHSVFAAFAATILLAEAGADTTTASSDETAFPAIQAGARTNASPEELKQLIKTLQDQDPQKQWAAANRLAELKDKSVVVDLVALLRAEGAKTREYALFALAGIKDPRSIEALRTSLSDPISAVSGAAKNALVEFGKEAEPSLLRGIKDDNPRAAWKCAALLAKLGNSAGADNLLEAVAKGSPGERFEGMKLLSEVGDLRAVPLLIDALVDIERDVSKKAPKPLGKMASSNETARGMVIKALQEKKDPKHKAIIADILGGMNDPRSAPVFAEMVAHADATVRIAGIKGLIADKAKGQMNVVLKAIDDQNQGVRRTAVLAVGILGDASSIPVLGNLMKGTGAVEVADAAAISLAKLGPASVPVLVESLNVQEARKRAAAARALGMLRAKDAIDPLIAATGEKDKGLRAAAAFAAGCTGDAKAVPVLIDLLADETPEVAEAAAAGLVEMGESAAEPVTAAYRRGQKGATDEVCARVLAQAGTNSIQVVEKFGRSENPGDRRVAAIAAGILPGDQGQELVLGLMRKDSDVSVRAKATAVYGASTPDDRKPLLAALEDPAPAVVIAAADAIGTLAETNAVKSLAKLLANGDAGVRKAGIEALGKTLGNETAPAILPFLEDKDAATRAAAATALGNFGEKSAAAKIARMIEDADRDAQVAAVTALGKIEDPAATAALRGMLSSKDIELRRLAIEGLGDRHDRESVGAILESSTGKDAVLRSQALAAVAEVLRKEKDRSAILTDEQIKAAAALLASPDAATRNRAQQLLGYVGERAVPAVAPYVKASNAKTTRLSAISALGATGSKKATPALVAVLTGDHDPAIQNGALLAIGGIKDPEALTPATRMLKSDNANVRASAARALGRMGDSRAVGALMKMSNDPDEKVRKNSREGLLLLTGNKCPILEAITPWPFVEPAILVIMILCLVVPLLRRWIPAFDAPAKRFFEKIRFSEKGQWWLSILLGMMALGLLTYSIYCQIVRPGLESFVSGFFPNLFLFTMKTFPFFVGGCIAGGLVMKYFTGRVQLPRSVPGSITMAALLPLCSCGAVPITRAMLTVGVPMRAVIAFVVVSPILNPFVMVLSYGVIGFWYLFFRVVGTIGIAWLMGVLIERYIKDETVDSTDPMCSFCKSCASKDNIHSSDSGMVNGLRLMGHLHRYIIIGVLMGTLIAAYVPMTLVTKYLSSDIFGLLLAVTVGTPLYLCTGEEVIFLKPLMDLGLPLGHAVAFTITSTGICISAIAVLFRVIGKKHTTALVAGFVILPFILGYVINIFFK